MGVSRSGMESKDEMNTYFAYILTFAYILAYIFTKQKRASHAPIRRCRELRNRISQTFCTWDNTK